MHPCIYVCVCAYFSICLSVLLAIYSANTSHSCSSFPAAGSNSVCWRDGCFSWEKIISGTPRMPLWTWVFSRRDCSPVCWLMELKSGGWCFATQHLVSSPLGGGHVGWESCSKVGYNLGACTPVSVSSVPLSSSPMCLCRSTPVTIQAGSPWNKCSGRNHVGNERKYSWALLWSNLCFFPSLEGLLFPPFSFLLPLFWSAVCLESLKSFPMQEWALSPLAPALPFECKPQSPQEMMATSGKPWLW